MTLFGTGIRESGMSYTDVKNLGLTSTLNSIANDSVASRMTGYLNTLRSTVGTNGLVTIYNDKPLFGVSAITAENGYTTYFDYGSDGKLSAIRDNDGAIRSFSYQYVNPYSGNGNSTNYVQKTEMLTSSTGNISVQKWKQGNESFNRGYKFTYDGLNRLTEAVYGEQDFSNNIHSRVGSAVHFGPSAAVSYGLIPRSR